MERKIECYLCSKYLGVVRDAKLHRQIRFVCYECSDDYIEEPTQRRNRAEDDQVVDRLFSLFGMKK